MIDSKIKLNRLKTFSVHGRINDVYIFPNKNILLLGNDSYKIYNKKDVCIKEKKNVYYKYIKIIDNDSFMCLKDDTKLMCINIKNGRVTKLFEFPEEGIKNLLFYGKKYITLNTYNRIKIWEKSSDLKFNCLTEVLLIKEKDEILFIFLVRDKNILIVNNVNKKITYFLELDKFSIIIKINDLSYKTLYQLNENLIIFPYSIGIPLKPNLNIYDFNKKEFIQKKIINFYSSCKILPLPKKNISYDCIH